MPVPDTREMYEPVLMALSDGSDHTTADVQVYVARHFNLTAGDLAERPPRGPSTVFVNHVAHVFRIFGPKGLTTGSRPGPYRITELGRSALANRPVVFDDRALGRLRESLGTRQTDLLPAAEAAADESSPPVPPRRETDLQLRPRAFDPAKRPAELSVLGSAPHPDELFALIEQARQGHHRILIALHATLVGWHWTAIEEISGAIDMRGRARSGQSVIFEAKTITEDNETHQARAALAQLLEYRLRYGDDDDGLCLVTDRTVTSKRALILHNLGVGVLLIDDTGPRALNESASRLVA